MTKQETKNLIRTAIAFDPISEAENIVGGELDETNFGVGLAFVNDKRRMMRKLMESTNDVHSDISFEEYCLIAENYGFECVYEEPFTVADNYDSSKVDETQRIYWHPKGFLLTLVSYSRFEGLPRVNSAEVYYNFQVDRERWSDFGEYRGSGCWDVWDEVDGRYVWAGYKDVRDALVYHLDGMCEQAEPLSQWFSMSHIWLCHYGDEKLPDDTSWNVKSAHFDKVNTRKVAALPENLRNMIQVARKQKRFHRVVGE